LEQLAVVFEGTMGESGVFGDADGFSGGGCRDDAEGWKDFLLGLERSVDWGNPTQAGLVFSSEQRRPELSVRCHSPLSESLLIVE